MADGAVPASRDEAGVVIEPLNASDLARVVLESVLGWAIRSVEFVHRDGMLVGAGKEVATVGESDFTAQLNADLLELLETSLENIHHADLVSETNNDVET